MLNYNDQMDKSLIYIEWEDMDRISEEGCAIHIPKAQQWERTDNLQISKTLLVH